MISREVRKLQLQYKSITQLSCLRFPNGFLEYSKDRKGKKDPSKSSVTELILRLHLSTFFGLILIFYSKTCLLAIITVITFI